MQRTTIMLPRQLKNRARRLAQRRGISLGELIRESLASGLERADDAAGSGDSLFEDGAVYTGEAPEDLSVEHDSYLYGDEQ